MVVATEYRVPLLARAAVSSSAADARLFALVEELKYREKRRDDLLDRLSIEDGGQVEAVAKEACDAARAIYEQIIAMKPTTPTGVLRQLELAAKGWVAPSTLPIAMAALRELADRPAPLKVGRLPPVPTTTGLGNNSGARQTAPAPFSS